MKQIKYSMKTVYRVMRHLEEGFLNPLLENSDEYVYILQDVVRPLLKRGYSFDSMTEFYASLTFYQFQVMRDLVSRSERN